MTIPYALFRNNLTPNPADFTAVVQAKGSAGFEEIAQRIAEQDHTVGEIDLLAVLRAMEKTCQRLLIEGNRVVLGNLVQLFPRVRGTFNGPTDSFDSARHRVDVGANPGQGVRDKVRSEATVDKVLAIQPGPTVLAFTDVDTQEVDNVITVGSIGKLAGSRLKFDPDRADEGLFLVPTDGGTAVKVETLSENMPSMLQFLNPALPAGQYRAEVRTRISGGSELRVGRLGAVLTVI